MPGTEFDRRVGNVRGFNRFYTSKIGVLQERYLKGPFSLTEARVLYELAHCTASSATALAKDLELDAGYLSRILGGFEKGGLLVRKRAKSDGRKRVLSLTARGLRAFAKIDADAKTKIGEMLEGLSTADQERLVGSMQAIESLLNGVARSRDGTLQRVAAARTARTEPRPPGIVKGHLGAKTANTTTYELRHHRPGDMGWVVQRHGALYAQEYGWDERFEALVAEIVAEFIRNYDPTRERCWIAEMDGVSVGSVFLVKKSETTAKLRLLLVEPRARGRGIGGRLVDECIRFAVAAGYRKITLWTNHTLVAARSLYEKAGFQLVDEEPHTQFGEGLIGQTWELKLST
jgi:DNA-binding MarR family transcriptional regulator/GNAT superfamily N-acetyltransferase